MTYLQQRFLIGRTIGFLLLLHFFLAPVLAQEPLSITVYKSPTCGCCGKWVEHLEDNGFDVVVLERYDMQPVKQQLGVAPPHQSCHTGVIGGYTIEGHVPAADIVRLIEEKPDVKGLAVPGMPMGSPGMEGPRSDPYSVLAIDRNDNATVYSNY